MDPDLRQRMLRYYDERAPEYEEAYTLGTGTSSIADPEVFRTDIAALAPVVGRIVRGTILDLACGTGYWLPHYAAECSRITLFDQSANMLAECRTKVDRLGIGERCTLVQGDVFDYHFDQHTYDCALIGFLVSHLTEPQEARLFEVLRATLAPNGRFLLLDSVWSEERGRFNAKVERQQRRLNDGTPFEIYKRYVDRTDLAKWPEKYGVTLNVEFLGKAFLAVCGTFEQG